MLRVEDFLKKERREIISHLTFTSIFTLIIGLAAGGCCWSYGPVWMTVVFFAVIIIIWSAILIGDRLTRGNSFVEQEIEMLRHTIKRLLDTEFMQVTREPWGMVTLIVMVSMGIAACINHNFLIGLLVFFIVGLLSAIAYVLLPAILVFLFEAVLRGPEEEVDDLDEWRISPDRDSPSC